MSRPLRYSWVDCLVHDPRVVKDTLAVALVLLQHMDGDAATFVGVRTIAERSGYSVPTVRKSIDRLLALGHLLAEPMGRGRRLVGVATTVQPRVAQSERRDRAKNDNRLCKKPVVTVQTAVAPNHGNHGNQHAAAPSERTGGVPGNDCELCHGSGWHQPPLGKGQYGDAEPCPRNCF